MVLHKVFSVELINNLGPVRCCSCHMKGNESTNLAEKFILYISTFSKEQIGISMDFMRFFLHLSPSLLKNLFPLQNIYNPVIIKYLQ